jgi:hypothetical protein
MKYPLVPLAALLVGLSPLVANAQAKTTANLLRPRVSAALPQALLQYGLNHLGKATMEAGQTPTCANFVAAALHAIHARSTEDYGVTGMNTNLNYIWGNRVLTVQAGQSLSGLSTQVRSGDILQFRNVNSTVKTTNPNGSWSTRSWSFPQHTAIVYQNLGNGRLVVLQQNSDHRQYVTRDTIDLSGMTSGTLWVYRPVAK